MAQKISIWQPHRRFFEAGQHGNGVLVIILQFSLIFWPLAIKMARRFEEDLRVQDMLNSFAQANQDRFPLRPSKRFRHAGGAKVK